MMFKDSYVAKAIENGEDVKKARDNARSEWDKLSDKHIEVWNNAYEEHKDLMEALKKFKPGKVNSYSLYVRDQVAQKGRNFTTAADNWKKESDKIKNKYAELATEENKDKQRLYALWEVANGVKPKRPTGPLRIFMAECGKLGKLSGSKTPISDCMEMFKKLSTEDRENYERMAAKERLEYQIKKAAYNKFQKSKGEDKRALSALNLYIKDKSQEPEYRDTEFMQGEFFKRIHADWKKEPDHVKTKYEKKSAGTQGREGRRKKKHEKGHGQAS